MKTIIVRLENKNGALMGYCDVRIESDGRLPVWIRARFQETQYELLGTLVERGKEMFFYREREFSLASQRFNIMASGIRIWTK